MSTVTWAPDEPVPQMTPQPTGGRKYKGDLATGYEAKRGGSAKWKSEELIVREMLDSLPAATSILDIPMGTGRFIPYYDERDFDDVWGYDIEPEMLWEAKEKLKAVKRPKCFHMAVANITKMALADNTFDVALMIRLERWLSKDDRTTALKNLQKWTRNRIIFTARVRGRPQVPNFSYEDIEAALDGWHIARDEVVANDEDNRMIMLEPVAC